MYRFSVVNKLIIYYVKNRDRKHVTLIDRTDPYEPDVLFRLRVKSLLPIPDVNDNVTSVIKDTQDLGVPEHNYYSLLKLYIEFSSPAVTKTC